MSHSFIARAIPTLKGTFKFKETTINSIIEVSQQFKKVVIAPFAWVFMN